MQYFRFNHLKAKNDFTKFHTKLEIWAVFTKLVMVLGTFFMIMS